MSLNKVMLIGNVGQEPKFTMFDNGGSVAQISLATTKKGYTTKDGQQVPDRTEWHNVVVQNGLAKVANQYIHKGDKLFIEGELKTRSYEDNDRIVRYITEIYAYNMEMLSKKQNSAPAPVHDDQF